jgi:hypothetical protein
MHLRRWQAHAAQETTWYACRLAHLRPQQQGRSACLNPTRFHPSNAKRVFVPCPSRPPWDWGATCGSSSVDTRADASISLAPRIAIWHWQQLANPNCCQRYEYVHRYSLSMCRGASSRPWGVHYRRARPRNNARSSLPPSGVLKRYSSVVCVNSCRGCAVRGSRGSGRVGRLSFISFAAIWRLLERLSCLNRINYCIVVHIKIVGSSGADCLTLRDAGCVYHWKSIFGVEKGRR